MPYISSHFTTPLGVTSIPILQTRSLRLREGKGGEMRANIWSPDSSLLVFIITQPQPKGKRNDSAPKMHKVLLFPKFHILHLWR